MAETAVSEILQGLVLRPLGANVNSVGQGFESPPGPLRQPLPEVIRSQNPYVFEDAEDEDQHRALVLLQGWEILRALALLLLPLSAEERKGKDIVQLKELLSRRIAEYRSQRYRLRYTDSVKNPIRLAAPGDSADFVIQAGPLAEALERAYWMDWEQAA